jgi:hypothetical protein
VVNPHGNLVGFSLGTFELVGCSIEPVLSEGRMPSVWHGFKPAEHHWMVCKPNGLLEVMVAIDGRGYPPFEARVRHLWYEYKPSDHSFAPLDESLEVVDVADDDEYSQLVARYPQC